jgi:hypothetical protein
MIEPFSSLLLVIAGALLLIGVVWVIGTFAMFKIGDKTPRR